MALKIRPLDDRVVVEILDAEETTEGGIVLPDSAKEKPSRGRIVAVGEGKLLDNGERAPVCVKVGDEVLFGKFSGTEVTINGEEYSIMNESDILAKVE